MGIEPISITPISNSDLQQAEKSSAAKSGAVDLEAILDTIAGLSPEDKARLLNALRSNGKI
jgi:hypothetical protein